jgi:excinuclease ABC subunit A
VIAEGTLKDILKNKKSLTAQYLKGTLKIAVPKKRTAADPERSW